MLNKIWFGLLLIGLVYGFIRPLVVGPEAAKPATQAVTVTQAGGAAASPGDGGTAKAGETPAPQKSGSATVAGETPAPQQSGGATVAGQRPVPRPTGAATEAGETPAPQKSGGATVAGQRPVPRPTGAATEAGETPAPQQSGGATVAGAAPVPQGSGAAAKAPATSAGGLPAALTDAGKKLTTAAIDAAKTSVEICIMLIGVMALWLGLMKIAEQAGLVDFIARGLRPLLAWLFPDVPEGHPAGGAMIMNFAANMLGLDNAATPLGLKAMKELQTLNPHGETVSNSMAMFLAINASSITIIPFTVIGYRAAAGSSDPAAPMVAMMLATACAVTTSIVACRLLQPLYPLGEPPAGPIASEGQTQEGRS